MIQYGWQKDRYDKRDYLHKRRITPIPDKFSLSQYLTEIRDQGNVGSCVGFGIGINLNAVKMALGIYDEWCSPTYIYNGARYLEGTLPVDMGCQPRDALDWTSDYGILLEHFWPYDLEKLDQSAPSTERIKKATRYKGFQYFRCVDDIDGLCDAISSWHFVSIGSPWFREWVESPVCGRLPKPSNNSFVVGGHETCLYGYDRTEGVFLGANSWGTGWGAYGLYVMPFEAIGVFKNRGGYDAHYITFSKVVDDSPIPTPTPSPCPWGKGTANFLNAIVALASRKGRFYYRNPSK